LLACFVGKYKNTVYRLFVDGRNRSVLVKHAKALARSSGIPTRIKWKIETIYGRMRCGPDKSARALGLINVEFEGGSSR